jgi:hypothetical protein
MVGAMSIQITGMWWSGLTRPVAVLGVLVGVFAMHGLTGNHEVTMAGQHMSEVASAAQGATGDHTMAPLDQASSSAAAAMGHLSAAASRVSAAAQSAFVPIDEHQHMMAGACLAMLTALVLLLALMLALRSLLAWRAVDLVAPAERPVLPGRSPPWLVTSQSKLCIFRT